MISYPIKLALLWGHMPRGIVRCSRNICRRRDDLEVSLSLARNSSTGRKADSIFSSFGEFHLETSQGPRPVSLVEVVTRCPVGFPENSASLLHSISIGFPVVGEVSFSKFEKFCDPVVPPPPDIKAPLIQNWIDESGNLLSEDRLSCVVKEFHGNKMNPSDSILRTLKFEGEEFDGEDSSCRYVDHPKASSVRRDRGSPKQLNFMFH
jgi:hypothetical protein